MVKENASSFAGDDDCEWAGGGKVWRWRVLAVEGVGGGGRVMVEGG